MSKIFSESVQSKCDPKEIALKSFFLGPQAENASWVTELLNRVFDRWINWRRSLFPKDGRAISKQDQKSESFMERRRSFEATTQELLTRFEKEVPKFSPRYVGHMFSEISLPALIGHIIALLHNPNNISGESSRVGTQIENEAIGFLLAMVGYSKEQSTGHFTSGGTIANFEALIRAQSRMALWFSSRAVLKAAGVEDDFDPVLSAHQGWAAFDESMQEIKMASINPLEVTKWKFGFGNPREFTDRIEQLMGGEKFFGPVLLVPENKHYSWQKGCRMLGLGTEALWPIPLDAKGRLSVAHLKQLIEQAIRQGRPILLVVSVAGTTELGGIDPVDQVQELLEHWKNTKGIHIWHHVDAAYGGFFRTLDLQLTGVFSNEIKQALRAISEVDSVTLDPHKLGYVPYASGAFLARDLRDYYFSTFEEAPYIDFDQNQDRGPYTIEGSRSAAGAMATWMAAKTLGLNPGGYGLLLERTTRIRKDLEDQLKKQHLPVQVAPGCDTNVLCFTCAVQGESIEVSNQRTLKMFEVFSPKNNGTFIVSKTSLRWRSYQTYLEHWTSTWAASRDSDEVVLIRMCMMNPFFGTVETKVNYNELFIKTLQESIRACQKTSALSLTYRP